MRVLKGKSGVMVAAGAILAASVAVSLGVAGAPQAAEQRIATVDIYSLVERMLDRPAAATPRDELANRLNDRINADQKALEALDRELQSMNPSDPRAGARQQEFVTRRDALNRLFQESSEELDRFRAGQLFEAYREARAAADAVAAKAGYTMVISNRAADAELTPQGMALAVQELMARPVLRYDPADDLTKQVEAELKLGQ